MTIDNDHEYIDGVWFREYFECRSPFKLRSYSKWLYNIRAEHYTTKLEMNEILNTEYANDRSRILLFSYGKIVFLPSSFLCSFLSLCTFASINSQSFGVGLKFNINIIALLEIVLWKTSDSFVVFIPYSRDHQYLIFLVVVLGSLPIFHVVHADCPLNLCMRNEEDSFRSWYWAIVWITWSMCAHISQRGQIERTPMLEFHHLLSLYFFIFFFHFFFSFSSALVLWFVRFIAFCYLAVAEKPTITTIAQSHTCARIS